MKATRYYQVAEHRFSVMTEPAHLTLMQNYEPFRCSDSGDVVFTLTIDSGEAPAYTEETRQEDEGQEIICGKSTHASLWLRHIEDSELLNDDNPVVRIGHQGQVIVYGSPWSGKTPCYRNVSYPLGAIVVLSQAPYNKIQRLSGIQAYVSLVASISGKRWDAPIADGLHWTEATFSCLTKSAVRSTKKQNVNSTTESSRPIPTKR